MEAIQLLSMYGSMDYLKRWTGKQNMWENNVEAENVF